MIKKKTLDPSILKAKSCHKVWHQFSNWLIKTYGKELHGKWKTMSFKNDKGKVSKFKYRSFDEVSLSRKLVGYEVQKRMENYVNRFCPEIKIVNCDDSSYSTSRIFLIPHPTHGITVMFIPQCISVQNQFFLYENHFKQLVKSLKEMKSVYKKIK